MISVVLQKLFGMVDISHKHLHLYTTVCRKEKLSIAFAFNAYGANLHCLRIRVLHFQTACTVIRFAPVNSETNEALLHISGSYCIRNRQSCSVGIETRLRSGQRIVT